jgi:hypothetical protein
MAPKQTMTEILETEESSDKLSYLGKEKVPTRQELLSNVGRVVFHLLQNTWIG